jgi:uncharacterized protein (TIGR02246 family)
MKRIMDAVFFLALMGIGVAAWAGPAEEVAQLSAPRLQALLDGNVDGYVAAFADNAVFHSSFTPFRIEGKEAIRAFFNGLVRMYPKRHVSIRQPVIRAYNDDLVVQDSYAVLNWYNEEGEMETYDTRGSTVWVKTGGRWQIVDQHISRLPIAHRD